MVMAATGTMFDTFAFAQKLREAGFNDKQVEAVTNGLHDIAMANVATKDDLRDLENRLTIKIGVITSSVGALIVAAIKLL